MATFDSYKDLLTYACAVFQPKNILEYGPGGSTKVMLETSDAHIHSIENVYRWFEEARSSFGGNDRVSLHYIKDHDEYVSSDFGLKYDLIFVDGFCDWRVDCLKAAISKLAPGGYVILHDSERAKYNKGKELYDKIFEINGTTLYQPL